MRIFKIDKSSLGLLKWNFLVLLSLGINLKKPENLFQNISYINTILSQIWIIVVMILLAVRNDIDLEIIFDSVLILVCATMSIINTFGIRTYITEIRTVFSHIYNKCMTDNDKKSEAVLKPFVFISRIVFCVQLIPTSTSLIILALNPFQETVLNYLSSTPKTWDNTTGVQMKELPLSRNLYGLAPQTILQYVFYIILYIYEILASIICNQGNMGGGVFFFNITMYLCGQIELLKHEIREIKLIKDSSEIKSRLDEIVKKHCLYLTLANKLNTSLSKILLIHVALNAGVNLILGVQFLLILREGMSFINIIILTGMWVLTFQQYLTYYAGDYIMSQTEKLNNFFYDLNWYELEPKLQRHIYFMSIRTKQPARRIIGGFYILNIPNFTSLMKASFSYFTILRIVLDI